jgi:hypothetical protein
VDSSRRELLCARIASGKVRLRVRWAGRPPRLVHVCRPTRDQLYEAEEVYREALEQGELQGLYDDGEVLALLRAEGLWTDEDQKLYDCLPKEIEEFKVGLYAAHFRSAERKTVRKALNVARDRFRALHALRFSRDHVTARGVAASAKARFVLGCSLRWPDGRPVFTSEDFWSEPCDTLEAAMRELAAQRVEEAEFRELARTEPWRTAWACREAGLFGVPSCDFTAEQHTLVRWSLLYDSVYEHPEAPSEEVVADDDMLDGWLLVQQRERKKRQAAKEGDELLTNEKVRQSDEVYLVAESPEEAARIDGLNDGHARAVKRQRMELLRQKGTVNELDMPDTKQRLRLEMARRKTGG